MRRLCTILIAVCLIQTTSLAQQSFSKLEIILGGTYLKQSFTNLPEGLSSESEKGAHAGASLRIGGPFYLEPGIGASGSGYTFLASAELDDEYGEELEDVLGHWGIRVPVQVGYRLLPESAVKLRVFAGVASTFLQWVEEDNDFEVEWDDYNHTLWDATLGAGIDVSVLTFSLVYEIGLTELFNEETSGAEARDVKLNGFGVSLGLRFAL